MSLLGIKFRLKVSKVVRFGREKDMSSGHLFAFTFFLSLYCNRVQEIGLTIEYLHVSAAAFLHEGDVALSGNEMALGFLSMNFILP